MGRPLPAMEVFALAIGYLVESLVKVGQDTTSGLSKDDFQWVITVPAIGSDSAKQFMREAAAQVCHKISVADLQTCTSHITGLLFFLYKE